MQCEMTTRQLEIAARELAEALIVLNEMKSSQGRVRSERPMRMRARSTAPGNAGAIHTAIDIDLRPRRLMTDVRRDTGMSCGVTDDGVGIAGWICNNAERLSERLSQGCSQVDTLVSELSECTRMARRAGGYEPETTLAKPEPRQYAPAICQRLAVLGYRATPELLQLWRHRSGGAITVTKRQGKSLYLLSEVLAYLDRKQYPDLNQITPMPGM